MHQGKAKKIAKPLIGKVTRLKKSFIQRRKYIFINDNAEDIPFGYLAAISSSIEYRAKVMSPPAIIDIQKSVLSTMQEDDVVLLSPSGKIDVLWTIDSQENCILTTEKCNCNCIMCPQPPKKDSSDLYALNEKLLKFVDFKKTDRICLTGGEPTLSKSRFLDLLHLLKTKNPKLNLTILTNGFGFKDFGFTKKVIEVGIQQLFFCISLHADTDEVHDNIVRSKKSFFNTVSAILNLGKFYQLIEIRFVITKLNYKRLLSFSEFIYRNFPFVSHVAFMGLEVTGFANDNFEDVWVDPLEYSELLKNAVLSLHQKNIRVSIYNVPLCLIHEDVWSFARKSISKWKNDYLSDCIDCRMRENCCGVFTTSSFNSKNIKPLTLQHQEYVKDGFYIH